MPKRSSDKEQEVLGQIFDFIFKEAEKKPEKRKPIKVSGLNGKSMLMDGIAAALERPGAFLTEQAAKDLNDALDITITKLKPDESNPVPSMKISASNLINILKDPMGTMQKAKDTADAMRKSGRVNFVGKSMREFVINGWARKYADFDTQQAVRLGMISQNTPSFEDQVKRGKDNWDIRAALGQAASGRGNIDSASLTNMQERAATLIGRSAFTEKGWNSLSDRQRDDFGKLFGMAQSTKASDQMNVNYTVSQLREELTRLGYKVGDQNQILQRYVETVNKAAVKDKISLAEPGFYRNLELNNIDQRIAFIKAGGAVGLTDEQKSEQVKTLMKSRLVINAQDLDGGKIRDANTQITSWIEQIKSEIRAETNPNKRSTLKKKLNELKGDRRELNSLLFWDTAGRVEGYWGSLQGLASGGLVTQILNGSFFDSDQNKAFCPSSKVKSIFGQDYFVPLELKRRDKNGQIVTNKIGTKYNKTLTGLYYFTPKSIMRTLLFNGEGFAYALYLRRSKIDKFLAQNLSADNLKLSGLINGLSDDYLKQIILGKSDDVIKNILASSGLQGVQLDALRTKLEGVIGNKSAFAKIGKAYNIFSFNARLKDTIGKSIEKFMVKRRAILVKGLMKSTAFRKFFSGAAGKLLGQWIQKGGLQSVARALVVGLANALGFATTGGLANILITGVAMVVSDALFVIGKVLLGIVVYAFFGIIAIILLAGIGVNNFAKKTFTYANTVPGMVVNNPNYKGTSEIVDPNDPVGPMDPFIGGVLPGGEKCLLGTGSFHCSQGPYGSYSHQNVAAIDVSSGAEYFYAPAFCGDNNCTVTYSGSTSCTAGYAGGMMIFSATYGGNTYQFTLIHVNPKYGVGAKLSSGERVARVMTLAETTNACSSGKHIHIQARMNGAIVNPRDVLNNSTSSGGFACNISECDK